jgi:rRNA biogenesis protein RRP5
MSYSTLARHRKVTVEVLRAELAKGQELEDLVVVSKNADKGFVIVGLVPSKATKSSTSAPEPAASGITFDNLVAGQVAAGRICGKVPTGLLVQLSKTIRGRVARTEVSDDYDLIEAGSLVIGTNVQCFVISVDKEYNRVDLSLRSSRLSKDVEVKDVLVKGPEDVKVGMKVRGFVKNIASQGLFVSLGGEVTARVLIKVSPINIV